MSTLPINVSEHEPMQRRTPKPISNARRQARMQKKLGVALFRDRRFDTLIKYALVWMVLLAVVAGIAETYASHDKYYPYNLDVPRKIL